MKITRLEKVYALILLVIFGGIVVHAPFSVGFGALVPQYGLAFKVWKEILMVIALMLGVIIVARHGLWRELFRDRIIQLIAAFAVLHIVLVPVFYQGLAPTLAGLAIDLRFLLYFGLVYLLLKVAPQYRQLMLQIGIIGAFVVVGFATLQFFLPPDILSHIGYSRDTIMPYLTVDKNPDYVRVNSTLRGPNPLGAYAGMVLALLTAALVRGRVAGQNSNMRIGAITLGVCGFAALYLSYSRSALVGGLLAVGIVLAVTVLRKLSANAWIAMSVAVFALIGGIVANLGNPIISNVLLHENEGTGAAVSSNEAHVESLIHGTERLTEQPLGAGIGSTGSASIYGGDTNIIENQYLFVAHEAGWLGLLIFMALFLFVLVRLWKRRSDWVALGVFASGIGLGMIGLLLPVWVDDTVSIVWWGLAAIALATGGKHVRHQAK